MSGRSPTSTFGANAARRAYALNSMCHSLAGAPARQAFMRDEEAYCRRFQLTLAEREAVIQRDLTTLIALGGAVELLERLPG